MFKFRVSDRHASWITSTLQILVGSTVKCNSVNEWHDFFLDFSYRNNTKLERTNQVTCQ